MYHAPDSSVSRRSTNWPSLSFSSTGCLPMASPPSRCAGPLRDAHDGGRTPRRKSGEGAKANGELHAEEYASTGIRSKGAATVREMRIVVAAESRRLQERGQRTLRAQEAREGTDVAALFVHTAGGEVPLPLQQVSAYHGQCPA